MKAALALLLAATAAKAQETRIERPFAIEIGAFFPDNDATNFPHDGGVFASLGYSFLTRKNVTLAGGLRGAYHLVTAGGGNDDILDGDLTISSAFLNARYRPLQSALFAGLDLGFGRANVVDDRNRTGLLVALEAGVYVSPTLYFSARYQAASVDTLRGGFVGIGYRF